MVWSLEHFRNYLLGRSFVVRTDHRALLSALKSNRGNKTTFSRLARWVDRLLPFTFTLVHIPSKSMAWADYMSRQPTGKAQPISSYDKTFSFAVRSHVMAALLPFISAPGARCATKSKQSFSRNQSPFVCTQDADRKQHIICHLSHSSPRIHSCLSPPHSTMRSPFKFLSTWTRGSQAISLRPLAPTTALWWTSLLRHPPLQPTFLPRPTPLRRLSLSFRLSPNYPLNLLLLPLRPWQCPSRRRHHPLQPLRPHNSIRPLWTPLSLPSMRDTLHSTILTLLPTPTPPYVSNNSPRPSLKHSPNPTMNSNRSCKLFVLATQLIELPSPNTGDLSWTIYTSLMIVFSSRKKSSFPWPFATLSWRICIPNTVAPAV